MPHQCIRCGTFYEDGSQELLKGCTCGSKFFFFMKKKDIEASKRLTTELTSEERIQIEQDVVELLGEKMEDEQPVVLDLESIRLGKPGQYEIDLVSLFGGKPLVYKLEEGKYVIDIVSSLRSLLKKDDTVN